MRRLKSEEIWLAFRHYPGTKILEIAERHFLESFGYESRLSYETDEGCICGPLKKEDLSPGSRNE